jgi:hypothetical protein
MTMQNVDQISKYFLAEDSSKYTLLIKEYPDGVTLTVTDCQQNNELAVRKTPETNLAILNRDEPLLQLHYKQVNIITKNLPFAIVPKKLFDQNQAYAYLPLPPLAQKAAQTIICELENFDAVGVLCDSEWTTINKGISKNISITHPLFDAINHIKPTGDGLERLAVEITPENLYIVAFIDHRLIFANAQKIISKEDIHYFLLLTAKQIGFEPETMRVNIVTHIDQKILHYLKQYLFIEYRQ